MKPHKQITRRPKLLRHLIATALLAPAVESPLTAHHAQAQDPVGGQENHTRGRTSSADTAIPHAEFTVYVTWNEDAKHYYLIELHRADCGQWSNPATAVNVPATNASPPVIQTPTVANFDEVSVQFTTTSESTTPPTHFPVVQLMQSDETTAGTFKPYETDEDEASSPVVFTDVDTNRYYKARAKSCADAARKLCGVWTDTPTSYLTVPAPYFPTLTVPTLSVGTTGSINAAFTLPSDSYQYLLVLRWSTDRKQYSDFSNPARLQHGDTTHTFTGLTPENGGQYLAAISACVDAARKNCGSEVLTSGITLPTIGIEPSGDVWLGTMGNRDISAVSNGLTTGQAYTVRFSFALATGATTGDLRFSECASKDPKIVSTDAPIPNTNNENTVSKRARIYSCGTSTGTLKVKLIRSGTEIASHTRKVVLVPVPTGVRVNGHGTSTNSQFIVRWDTVAAANSYKIRYAISDDDEGLITTVDSWTMVTHTNSTLEKTVTGLTAGRIYQVQVKALKGTLETGWSKGAFVKPTHQRPVLRTQFAGIPMTKFWAERTYSYEICTDTFPTSAWVTDIEAAIALWPRYVKWSTDGSNIITATGTSSDCGTSGCYDDNPATGCDKIEEATSMNRIIRAQDQAHLNRVCDGGMKKDTLACVVSHLTADKAVTATLMVFGSDDVEDEWEAGDHADDPEDCSYLFDVALHEAGHAIGLGDVDPGALKVIMTAMRQKTEGPCWPTSQDIGAVMTLYQSLHR